MIHKNELEGRLFSLERELEVAILNELDFEISIIKDEIKEVENELMMEEAE